MINIDDLKPGEITYTHKDPETGEYRHFAVERISMWLALNPEIAKELEFIIPVDPAFASFIGKNRGIETHRLIRLIELKKLEPILMAKMPDETCLIIDGNHRYVVAAMVRATEMVARILEPKHWEPFLIEGISKELAEFVLSADSGIN